MNSGNYAGGGVAPGSIASVFGTGLAAPQTVMAPAIPLSTAPGNVESVTFGGVPAPLYFVSDGQINVQVPWDLGLGPVDVIVTTTVGPSAPVSVTIVPAAPGIFAASANGLGQAVGHRQFRWRHRRAPGVLREFARAPHPDRRLPDDLVHRPGRSGHAGR